MRLSLILLAVVVAAGAAPAQDITAGVPLAADDFDRFTDPVTDLGALPTGGQTWGKRLGEKDGQPIDVLVRGIKGALYIGYSSGSRPTDCGVYLDGLTPADAVVEVTVGPSSMADRAHTAFVSYRAADPQSAAGGQQPGAYHVQIAEDWSGSRDVVLSYGKERLAAADLAGERDQTASHRVQVAFACWRHQVWVDGQPVIDYWESEAGRNGPGHVGFGGSYSIGPFDDFSVATAIPGVALPEIDTSGGRIAPLIFQGRPFFPLGTYGAPGPDDVAEWVGAGGNAVIVHEMYQADPPEERKRKLLERVAWGAEHDVALVYAPAFEMYSRDGEQLIPTRPEEIPAKVALIDEMLAVTADDPQTLGYWTFDEPENVLYKAYREWEAKQDKGLAAWIAEGMSWTYDALKAGDPDAYVMPTIAWWTTYEEMAPMWDVLVPNTYPTQTKDEPMTGDLFTVVFDAVKSAEAVRATGRHSFVFMPGIFDIIGAPWRAPTRSELRYTYFAPLTEGAMGILPWRLGRCSRAYQRAVIYPVMREVAPLIPWLLGEWHDEQVTSDRDTATAEYLTKLPKRIRLVAGEEQAEAVEVDAVGDCSHMLRRRPDNTWLLLAVSNRKEPMTVTFTISGIVGLPDSALEMIDYRPTRIDGGRITETLGPFGVRAWVFEPE